MQSNFNALAAPARTCAVAAICIFAAQLAACTKGTPASAAASAASAAVDVSAASAETASAQPVSIDYGDLGKPDDPNPDPDIDGHITSRSPAQNLKRFRDDERNPPQGMSYEALKEEAEVQRARFYAAAEAAPQLITPQDWRWVRSEEALLITDSCDEQDNASPPVAAGDRIPDDICAKARAITAPGAAQ